MRKLKATGNSSRSSQKWQAEKNIREATDGENDRMQPADVLRRPARPSGCRWCHCAPLHKMMMGKKPQTELFEILKKTTIWTSQLHFGMRCGRLMMKQRLSYLVIRRGINHGSWKCLEGWWSKIPSFKIQAPIWGCRKKVIFCKKEQEALLNTWFIFCCGAQMNARYFLCLDAFFASHFL